MKLLKLSYLNAYLLITNMILAIDFIKARYEIVKQEVEDVYKEEIFHNNKVLNYIHTTKSISRLLTSYTNKDMTNDDRVFLWYRAFDDLLANAILEKLKPKLKLEHHYGYRRFDFKQEEQLVMQFLEGYLACQKPKLDPIWFIELGVKLELINIDLK